MTRRNLSQLEEIADWVYLNEINQFGVSLVIPEGRAVECGENDLFLSTEEIYEFQRILSRINEKYPDFISIIDDNSNWKNCGCISNCMSITVDGDIKMCAMDNGNALAVPMGNLFSDTLKNIYEKHQVFVNLIDDIEAPDYNNSLCQDCKYISYCEKCLLRAINTAKKVREECKWAAQLPDEIIKYFFADGK